MDSAQGAWQIDLFGGLRARRGEAAVERFQTQKTGALLACLAYQPHRRHSREELIDLLWPDAEPDAGRHRLSQALVWLRSQLEPAGVPRQSVLLADRQSIGIRPDSVVTDVAQFVGVVLPALKAPEAISIPAIERALQLYQGDLLPGLYDDWVLSERQRLQGLFIEILRLLVQKYEWSHQYGRALEYARRALDADPLAEELHRDLMRLLAADGQQAAALRQYRELERLLAREMNETPASATQTLFEQIRQGDPPPARLPPLDTASTLPQPLTRFFGREDEMMKAEALLTTGGVRLLTLTGVGGGGKTRLAIEIARRLAGHYGGAVRFVPLADLSDAEQIPDAIVEAMRLSHAETTSIESVANSLPSHPSLLVLDNLEHLAAGAAPMIAMLLAQAPALTVLLTSRQRLGLAGEREITVPPLQAPVGSFGTGDWAASPQQLMALDSVRLFVDRAQAVRPAFQITPQNAAAAAQLCERLEGIPLAIELCAAWAQTLTPAQMLAQLTRRFDILISRHFDIPARHHSLRAALEYSYGQLPPEMQRVFSRLSVFRGGWTLEAVQAVAQDGPISAALEATTELRERSLLLADESEEGMRYRMLETLREFAEEHLLAAEVEQCRQAHAVYFLGLAESVETQLSGQEQSARLARLEAEHDNLRAALSWTLESQSVEIGLRLAGALAVFWDLRGYLAEGQEWLGRLLALAQDAPAGAVRAKALAARGYLARNQGASIEVNAAMREALALWRSLGDERGMATSLLTLATLAYSREDCDEAWAHLEESLALARKIGDQSLIARVLLSLGNIALEQCELDAAWDRYAESLGLYQKLGARSHVAYAFNNMGLVARYRGDLTAAQTLLQDALDICREVSDRAGIAEALLNLGTVHRMWGRLDDARSALAEAAVIATEAGDKRLLAWCVKERGHVACAEGDAARAARLLSAAESLRRAMGISFKPAGPEEISRDLSAAREALGASGFAAAVATGSGLSLPEAVSETMLTRNLPV